MLPAIMALAQFAPSIIGLLTKDKTASKAADIVSQTARVLTGTSDDAAALTALKDNPELQVQFKAQVDNHALAMYQEDTKRLEGTNETIRTEYANKDWYVRRMRPTFGYIMALSWGAQMGAITYRIIRGELAEVAVMITSFVQLTPLWLMGLSVLGLYVHNRSKDKQPASTGIGLLGALAKRIAGKV